MNQRASLTRGAACLAQRLSRWLVLLTLGYSGAASAILLDRGPDMVYDNVLNITWTRNANLPGSSILNWANANAFAANLVFGGFNDWRLPYASVAAGVGPITTLPFGQPCSGLPAGELACRNNEMAYMFYYNLGGTFGSPETGTQTAVGGQVLTGIRPVYWSGTEFSSGFAWRFNFVNGDQSPFGKPNQLSAWAVRPGDVVAAVPEPSSLLLIGVGALGLGWSWRRGRRR